MTYHKSAGPAVWKDSEGRYRGACLKTFSGGVISCIEYRSKSPGGGCGWCDAVGQVIPDYGTTPDFCPYLISMVDEAEMMDAMGALGLDAGKKKDLLAVVRAMPKEHRPRKARDLSLMQLHTAIRRARDAGWEMAT